MKFYLFYVLLYVLFAFSLGGFLLTHLGHVYHGAPEYEYQVNIYPKIFKYNKVSTLGVESLPSFCEWIFQACKKQTFTKKKANALTLLYSYSKKS